ncbi:hypothetical protein niasHT_039979 [Heterodera trifolii]|uniref:Uncharacterized protein n=1 Tax=Heterodera trifolii TaxID=157864 RepID=A0ABD2J3T8_9BILA
MGGVHCCAKLALASAFTLIMSSMIHSVGAVHGHHFLRKTAQQKQTEDAELEEELDLDEEENHFGTANSHFVAQTNDDSSFYKVQRRQPSAANGQNEQQPQQQQQQQFAKDTVFEQGETRDFLAFLRRIRYDHRQCPQNNGQPVVINVSVVVSNVRAVSEVTMDYSLEMFYRESWTDERLQYEERQFRNKTELTLHESYSNFLWHPDTFMPNAIASKNPRKQSISHRSLLRLQSNGQILYSRRLSVVAECPMDLTLFPFDSQTCKLGIESYGYTSDQVSYGWSKGQREALKLHKIRLPDFRIKEAFVTSQLESYATGNYSRLYVCFVFSRSAGFCFLQLIIPSTAVVITSWVSLWMENETSFQDMISIILTITFLLFSYNEVMPRVSYLKALDIWLAVCFMIVFLSLIKLALMKYMRQRIRIVTGGAQSSPSALLGGMLPIIQLSTGGAGPMMHYGSNNLSHQQQSRPATPPPTMRSSFTTMPPITTASHHRSLHYELQRLHQQQQLPPSNSCRSRHPSVADDAGATASRESRQRSVAGSSEDDLQQQQQKQRHNRRKQSTLSQGLEMTLGSVCIPQLMTQSASRRRKGGSVDSGGAGGAASIQPYQTPISTLAAAQMQLPLNESSLRQLQQQTLYQAQQLQLHVQLQQQALHDQWRRERRARRDAERLKEQQQRQQQQKTKRRLLQHHHQQQQQKNRHKDCNDNELLNGRNGIGMGSIGAAAGYQRSPVNAIRIGIESSTDSSSSDSDALAATTTTLAAGILGHRQRRREKRRRLFFGMFDEFGNVEFSASFIRRFHWVTQMSFFFFFVIFCLYFFLVYPHSRTTSDDPACNREEAEWYASIPA